MPHKATDRTASTYGALAPGQHILHLLDPSDAIVAEVAHALPYLDADRTPLVALTLNPIDGDPIQIRRQSSAAVDLATDADVAGAREHLRRMQLADGLSALADFYRHSSTMPVARHPKFDYCVLASTDEEGRAEIARIAQALGVEPTDPDNVQRRFGPVEFRAFYSPRERMAAYTALTSYSGSVQPTEPAPAGA